MTLLDKFMIALGFQVDDSGLNQFEHRAESVRESAIGLAEVVSGVLTSAFAELFKSFVQTGAEFEKYAVTLGVLYESVDKGKEMAGWISKFAAETPFQLDEVSRAFIRLKAFGLDPTNGTLKTIGDTAAAFGRPLEDIVFAFNDAIEGINRPLRTLGISVKEAGDMVTYSYLKNGKELHTTINKTNKLLVASTLQAIWNDRYGGAMDKLSVTWGGMWSNLEDQMTRFKQTMMNSGVFDSMKNILKQVLDMVNKAVEDGTAQKFGEVFGVAFRLVMRMGKSVWTVLDTIVKHTVGWKIALSALAFVLTGVVAGSIMTTISLITKLIGTVLAFDAAAAGVFLFAGALVLIIDDLWTYYHGGESLIGQLQKKYPHALGIAYAAILALSGAMVALKWSSLASFGETIAIMGLYVIEWGVAAAAAVASGAAIVASAAATAVGWVISFGAMAIATIAATWPILAIIAALALVGGAITLLFLNWDKVMGAMRKGWGFLLDEIKAGILWITDKVGALGDKALSFVKAVPGIGSGLSLYQQQMQPSPAGTASSFLANSVNSGGGVIGRAGSSSSTSTQTHTTIDNSKTEVPITIVSSDPNQAGAAVQKVLDQRRRKVVRNGQSAMVY